MTSFQIDLWYRTCSRIMTDEPCGAMWCWSFSVGFERSPHLLQVVSENHTILFCYEAPEIMLCGLQNLPQFSIVVGMRRERLNFYIFAWTFPLVFTVTDASFASLLINLYFMQEIKDSDDCLGQQGKKKTRQDLRVYSLQKMFQTTCISGAKTC